MLLPSRGSPRSNASSSTPSSRPGTTHVAPCSPTSTTTTTSDGTPASATSLPTKPSCATVASNRRLHENVVSAEAGELHNKAQRVTRRYRRPMAGVSDGDLVAAERTLGVTLPDDYRAFMRERDGHESSTGNVFLQVYSLKTMLELNAATEDL